MSFSLHRRDFLRGAAALPLAPALRSFGGLLRGGDDRILVVLELNGGNDGVNTVVPIRDEGYAVHREELALAGKDLLSVDADHALHPSLRGLAKLLERGELAIVPGAGYPDPNLSHEVSMATWHTARFDRAGRKGTGWLGRVLDLDFASRRAQGVGEAAAPGALLAGPHAMPGALRTRRAAVAAVPNLSLIHILDT